jgi:predicted secreted protein
MGKINGKDFQLFIDNDPATSGGEVAVGCSNNIELTIDVTMLEGVCRDDNGWQDRQAGTKSWQANVTGFVVYTNTFNVEEIYDIMAAGTKVRAKFTTNISGDLILEGDAYINNFTQTGEIDGFMTYSFSLMSTGELTKSTV